VRSVPPHEHLSCCTQRCDQHERALSLSLRLPRQLVLIVTSWFSWRTA
jgi:hypothetical protein